MHCKCSSVWKKLGYTLVAIGAINWGLIGLGYFLGGNWDVLNMIFGTWPVVENVVYIAIGIPIILSFWGHKNCRCPE